MTVGERQVLVRIRTVCQNIQEYKNWFQSTGPHTVMDIQNCVYSIIKDKRASQSDDSSFYGFSHFVKVLYLVMGFR